MNRHEMRVKVMNTTYQHLLLDKDIFLCLANNLAKQDEDPFIDCLILSIKQNKNEYIRLCNKNLKDWTFDRLGKVEQAIFLMSIAEIASELNEKAIVINEAITFAKAYCDDDTYKMINATLDKI